MQEERIIEEALLTWVLQKLRTDNNEYFGYLNVAKKLMNFNFRLQPKKPLKPSVAWVNDFKARHKFQLIGHNYKLTTTTPNTFDFIFTKYISDRKMCPAQVYIADEAGLYWKLLLNKRDSPEMITFLTCTNVTGQHKLKPLVIGDVKNPISLRNVDLPIHYYSQKKSWINRELFKRWFYEIFVPEVREWLKKEGLPEQALLLIDSASCHPSNASLMTEDESIGTLIVPCKPTETLATHRICEHVKRNYKDNILRLAMQRESMDMLLNFNLKDMAFILFDSWKNTPTSLIMSVWESLNTSDGTASTSDVSSSQSSYAMMIRICETYSLTGDFITKWYEGDGEERNGSHHMSNNEIILSARWILEDAEEDRAKRNTPKKISPRRALPSIEFCIRWAEEKGYFCSEIALLRRMRVKALSLPSPESGVQVPKRVITEDSDDGDMQAKRLKTE